MSTRHILEKKRVGASIEVRLWREGDHYTVTALDAITTGTPLLLFAEGAQTLKEAMAIYQDAEARCVAAKLGGKARPAFNTEATKAGEQYVIPGCERKEDQQQGGLL